MKELIVHAVALGYQPLFYTKRGTINAMAKKLEKITIERCKPLELFCLQKWLREGKKIIVEPHAMYNDIGNLYFNYFIFPDESQGHDYETYEESLFEGLKESLKLRFK